MLLPKGRLLALVLSGLLLQHPGGAAPGEPAQARRLLARGVTTRISIRVRGKEAAAAHTQPAASPGQQAYLAACVVVKEQNLDIRDWVDYHHALGVGRFYVYDHNSTVPLLAELSDLVAEGIVSYHYLSSFSHHSSKPQLYVYDTCLTKHAARHTWMAFIDATDEFLVLRDAAVPSLAALLEEYTRFAALVVNWQIFGPSGHVYRPAGGTLASYTACFPQNALQNRHVKTIANLRYTEQAGVDPHHFLYKEGRHAVNTAQEWVEGGISHNVVVDRLALHHYVTKSQEDYMGKMSRGSAMGNRKSVEYFHLVEDEATENCSGAVTYPRGYRFSGPRAP